MLTIKEATRQDFDTIREIAHNTWPTTFANILSAEQIAYMLAWMYSPDALREQVNEKKHQFLLCADPEGYKGFASFELDHQQEPCTKIHKLYVLPNTQGKGVGKALIGSISKTAASAGNMALLLNVNRFNKAVAFYQHLGFKIVGQEDIDIGNGFLMEDFIMKKMLSV